MWIFRSFFLSFFSSLVSLFLLLLLKLFLLVSPSHKLRWCIFQLTKIQLSPSPLHSLCLVWAIFSLFSLSDSSLEWLWELKRNLPIWEKWVEKRKMLKVAFVCKESNLLKQRHNTSRQWVHSPLALWDTQILREYKWMQPWGYHETTAIVFVNYFTRQMKWRVKKKYYHARGMMPPVKQQIQRQTRVIRDFSLIDSLNIHSLHGLHCQSILSSSSSFSFFSVHFFLLFACFDSPSSLFFFLSLVHFKRHDDHGHRRDEKHLHELNWTSE